MLGGGSEGLPAGLGPKVRLTWVLPDSLGRRAGASSPTGSSVPTTPKPQL
ncbi:hypothetical protein [Amycolatopsis plumensis]